MDMPDWSHAGRTSDADKAPGPLEALVAVDSTIGGHPLTTPAGLFVMPEATSS